MHVKADWWDRKASSQNSVGQKESLTCKEVVWSWPLQTGSGGGEVKGGRMNPTGGWLTVDCAHKYLWSEEKRQASEWAWVKAQPFPPLLVLLRARGFLGQLLLPGTGRVYSSRWVCTAVVGSHMGVPVCRMVWDDGTGSCSQHLEVAFRSRLLTVFLFLQELVNHTHKESADFGLSISGINKGSGEENVHPREVSVTHELNTKWGNSLFFLKMKNFKCYICQRGKVICDDQRLAVG